MDGSIGARALATGLTAGAIVIAGVLRGAPAAVPIDVSLDAFPLAVAGWTGQDLAVDPAVTAWLRSDAFTFRAYTDGEAIPVWILVDYHRAQHLGATVHSPRHCYTGEGWSVTLRDRPETAAGARLGLAQWLRMRREREALVGAYWYETRAGATADEVALKVRVAGAALRHHPSDAALVRLTTPVVGGDEDAACLRIARFADVALAPLLAALPLGPPS